MLLKNIKERHQAYLEKDFDQSTAVKAFLQRIKKNKELNAFIQVYEQESLKFATELDARRDRGEQLGPLAGLTVALKDNICFKNHRVTCGSKILENFVSPYHATVVEKILGADGIILGKTNLDEFAMGSSNENSYFGPVKNPHDLRRVSGGSSGGSTVAVAANLTDVALGSETGGSVRQPAAFCGVVGLKPSYGRVSRYGLVAYASSLDQIALLGRTVADVSYFFNIIAGVDSRDSTSADQPVPDYLQYLNKDVKNLKIGVPKQYFQEGLDIELKERIERLIQFLEENDAMIYDLDLSTTDYAIATYYILATAEASSNLARYDGVKYGLRSNSNDLQTMYRKTRNEGFGSEVKRRIMLGTYVLSAGYYDAYYRKAQQVRRLIKTEFDQAFQKVDLILTPTTPTPAFKIGEKINDPLQMYLSDIFTVTANLTGICGINIPIGKSKSNLPLGVQFMANAFREDMLIKTGDFVENCFSSKFS
jgi:aspartyl-tRNA(Asn)/glutamyl-tRNA(Gln) amidotransferase subunit A